MSKISYRVNGHRPIEEKIYSRSIIRWYQRSVYDDTSYSDFCWLCDEIDRLFDQGSIYSYMKCR